MAKIKRVRLAAAKHGNHSENCKVPAVKDVSKLQGTELRAALRRMPKKHVVLIAGYPNIKTLVKANGGPTQAYYTKNRIISEMV